VPQWAEGGRIAGLPQLVLDPGRMWAYPRLRHAILAEPGGDQGYFPAAAANIACYYGVLKRCCEAMFGGCDDAADLSTNRRRLNHYLKCDEHWDVLEGTSLRAWPGVTDVPDDLNDLDR
jgi:hypothetical protein